MISIYFPNYIAFYKKEGKATHCMSNNSTIRAKAIHFTYRNEENGFSVVKAKLEKEQDKDKTSEKETIIVGPFPPDVTIGSNFIAKGNWKTHHKYGEQFQAKEVAVCEPTTKESIEEYLGSGVIKGIGPSIAKKIVNTFGDETLEILDKNPQKLMKVSGIGKNKLQDLLDSWKEKRAYKEVFMFFQSKGLPISFAQRVFSRYGLNAIDTVKRNPYILAKDIRGIGFLTADQVAKQMGFSGDHPHRLSAGLNHTLDKATDDGHCFLKKDELISKSTSLLSVENKDLLLTALENSIENMELKQEEDRIYLPRLQQAEVRLCQSLVDRITSSTKIKEITQNLVEELKSSPLFTSDNSGTQEAAYLSERQKQALELAAKSQLLIITGGPGCGKTTLVRKVVELYRKAGLRIKLAAPTGRAAQRLSEVCSHKASTIHRLLKYDPVSRKFKHDELEPLELDALIIDESSMIDLTLAMDLFLAIPTNARVIIVGDADQLPSVGPGRVLSELLEVKTIPRVQLNELFRRASDSPITHIAHEINTGKVPHIPQAEKTPTKQAYFVEAESSERVAELVETLAKERIPKAFKIPTKDITILTPMNQGIIGVNSLNQRLQNVIIKEETKKNYVMVGTEKYFLHDRVCQRVNNYNITSGGVFNGDQGEIIALDPSKRELTVKIWDAREVTYSENELKQLSLAYAITIHRSQGSEVPAVILVLHDSHKIMLERQLIYTGITRAKSLLIFVGSRSALKYATSTIRSIKRNTSLAMRLETLLPQHKP